jgi:hypothetical protein
LPSNPFPRYIESVAQFLTVIQESRTQGVRYYFRGEPEAESPTALLPSLLRPRYAHLFKAHSFSSSADPRDSASLLKALVGLLIRYAEQYNPDISANLTPDEYISWITVAQHHSLPTLLLDWSLNPLVALFFACDIEGDKPRDTPGDVWQMPLRPRPEREDLTIHLDQLRYSEKEKGKAVTKALLDGLPFDEPVVIVPRILTRRIETQAGRFIFSSRPEPLHRIPDDVNRPWSDVRSVVRIGSDALKVKIREELVDCRIHYGTMFADLDGYARYLAGGGL